MILSSANPEAPLALVDTQKWFASIITRPIDSLSQMNPISPSGRPLIEEAEEFIAPSQKLSAFERIQIYNQQYWWRLLTILQQNFPTVTRLFGYTDFNETIAMPFLSIHLSRHWSLSLFGEHLTLWMEQYYSAEDKPLILAATQVDWAYQIIFYAPSPFFLPSSSDLLTKKLAIQSHIKLFHFPFDLFSFRSAFLKEEPDFWLKADFPLLPKDKEYYFIVFRTQKNVILYKEVHEAEWTFLHLISQGLSISEACDFVEKRGGLLYQETEAHLDKWIQDWLKNRWLCIRPLA